MPRFDDYWNRYETIAMERTQSGVLSMRFHTNGGPLIWGAKPHSEFPRAFRDVADDPANLVVIMTGTGTEFSGTRGFIFGSSGQAGSGNPNRSRRRVGGDRLLQNLLRIGVPVISVINGPAWRHAEIPLLADIVLVADDALFQDSAHFVNGLAPGDGQHVILPMLMGITRARYYLLTGEVLTAERAQQYGMASEVLPRDRLMPRAFEWAGELLKQDPIVLRTARHVLTEHIKTNMIQYLGHGESLEALGFSRGG